MAYLSDESIKLKNVLSGMGYDPHFCELIAVSLRTPWTANRMLGYLRQVQHLSEEDIADEMLAILSDRDRIVQKKEMEFYQGKINEMYMYGLDVEDEDDDE